MDFGRWKHWLEYLGGAQDAPPPAPQQDTADPAANRGLRPWQLAVLWAVLLTLILMFSGQTSKFIYIDF